MPGTGTMHDLNDIMGKAPTVDDANGAAVADVANGKTFWGLTTAGWGTQTGTSTTAATCPSGNLNGSTRWCENGIPANGTVTDLTTGLVWLKNAKCTGTLATINNSTGFLTWSDAVIWSSAVVNGTCGLADGSTQYEWRLPTRSELQGLANGTDQVRCASGSCDVFGFTGVQSSPYWTSTTDAGNTAFAFFVWPVRGG